MLHTVRGTTPRRPTARVRGAAAALAVPVLLVSVAACGGGGDGSADAKQSGPPAVTGKAGHEPKIAAGEGDPPDKLRTKVLTEGKGGKVGEGDIVSVDYVGQLWNGKKFDSSWSKERGPLSFEVGGGSMIKAWDEALTGKKVGSRVEIVAPPDKAYGPAGKPPTIPGNATLVFVVDVEKKLPGTIDGKPVEGAADPDLPEVATSVDEKRAPAVKMPAGRDKAPDEVVSRTVVEGDGPAVGDDSKVIADYTAKMWKDGKQLDDTWKHGGAQELPVAGMPGWAEGLKGKKAGSRVVVSVPASEFPEQERKRFASGVVFAVDLLRVD